MGHWPVASADAVCARCRMLLILATRCDGQPVLLQGQYSYSVHLQQYYSAEYEYTIRPE